MTALKPDPRCFIHQDKPKKKKHKASKPVDIRSLYAMRCEHAVKFGVAIKPLDRLADMQVSCPFKIELIASIRCDTKMETIVHKALASDWIRGEWFRSNDRIEQLIAIMRRGNVDEGAA